VFTFISEQKRKNKRNKMKKSIQKTIPGHGFLKPAKKPEKNGAK
jgi:hypothetical protein